MKYEISSYSVSKKPLNGVCKSPAIWGTSGNMVMPFVYLRKPKWISDASFEEIIDAISLNLPYGFIVERGE